MKVIPLQRKAAEIGGSPIRKAAISALLYVVVCITYILVSGKIAAAVATSAEQLQSIEAMKGVAFVVATGMLLFLISLVWLQRIKRHAELLVQSERKAVAGMYSASLAHDLNNLLVSLSGLVSGLKKREEEEGNDSLRRMRSELERAIENLSGLSKRVATSAVGMHAKEMEEVDLLAALTRIVGLVRRHRDVRGCEVELGEVCVMSARLNAELFEQALTNLVINAAQATGGNGRIEIVLRQGEKAYWLEVHDNGPGVPAGEVDRLFDPGYTTKQDGTGLGLLSVQVFAASCGGEVMVDRSHLGGAAFRVRIPSGKAGMAPFRMNVAPAGA